MDKKSDSIPIPGPSRLVQALTAIKTYDNREPNQVSLFIFYLLLLQFDKKIFLQCVILQTGAKILVSPFRMMWMLNYPRIFSNSLFWT